MTTTVRVGTRSSALARTQTAGVAAALGTAVELVPITTEGDRSRAPLATIEAGPAAAGAAAGTGVFVSALRAALLAGTIDVAVHSCKDLPTAPEPGIALAALPRREDPRDALVTRHGATLAELATGARVGTGAPRRAAQLRALGLGVEVVAIRGNVDTRLAMVADGRLDAVVLALSGLRRLGRDGEVSEILDPIQVLPAPAQGALAVECRADDAPTRELLAALDDGDTRAAVTAERAVLAGLRAGCSAPVGALCEVAVDDDGAAEIFLRASVTALDGSGAVRLSATGPATEAEAVGRRLAADLLAGGADQLMGRGQ
ncbi:MAG: hydroxymethylbilane synthase [Jatrophihabitans sp.]|nr:MAG: hydroxymethylbilane synthase [Jatrophihabitans sp.]